MLLSFLSILVIHFMIYANTAMNILRKFTYPINDCTSILFQGRLIFWIASKCLGLILIHSLEMMCPSNFPSFIAKLDLLGLREMLIFLHFLNTYSRCAAWSSYDLENTMMSSKYITRILSFSSAKAMSIACRNVALAFMSSKNIFAYMKVPHGMVNTVFS